MRKKNYGSIKNNYETDSEEEEEEVEPRHKSVPPGPGHYLKEHQTSTFGNYSKKPD